MGSSGSGRITDYPGSSKSKGNGDEIGGGGQSPQDRCGRAFRTPLEDIEHSEYYKSKGVPPPVEEKLRIGQRKRLVAETFTGQSVGNIPTSFNYLAACLKTGWTYEGLVTASKNGPPLASVMADFVPIPPP